jgi:hypothetical protein
MHPSIKIGPASIVGLVVSVLSLLPPVITEVVGLFENVAVHWTSAEKTALIVGALTAGITIVGRFAQAVASIIKTGK